MRNTVHRAGVLITVALSCGLLNSCGSSSNPCKASATVTPASATADHSTASPGDQVQFSTAFSSSGGCALPQIVSAGKWSTSDPADVTITNNSQSQAVAACVNATPGPVTVSYSGTIYGYSFASATLTCK